MGTLPTPRARHISSVLRVVSAKAESAIATTMSFRSKAIFYTGWGALGGTLGYVLLTRKNKIQPVSPSDYIYNTTLFARYNPNNTPATNDVCIRKVPLKKIKPELLEAAEKGETTLVERFCAGVWSGWGELMPLKKKRVDSQL